MNTNLEASAAFITKATGPEDVFGKLSGKTVDEQLHDVTAKYRTIVKIVHPDHHVSSPTDTKLAQEVFAKLTLLRQQAETKINAKTYGNRKVVVPPPGPSIFTPQVIKTPKRTYTLESILGHGDIADLYVCSYQEDKKEHKAVFKVSQSPADNDLMENESKILGELYPKDTPDKPKGLPRYLPRLIDSFLLRSAKKTNRRANVLQFFPNSYTIADVIKAYPKGLDYRDAAWIMRRMLEGTCLLHQAGFIHGSITPEHVLIHPIEHGAQLIDWCYAVHKDPPQNIKAVSVKYKSMVPPEVLAKKPAVTGTDVYMIAKVVLALLSDEKGVVRLDVPVQVKGLLNSCLLVSLHHRTSSAGDLYDEFDVLLKKLVGKPQYRPLVMPAK